MSGWRKAKLARARRRSLIVGSRRLWGDTSGLMAPYVAVMLPVLVGFALLALDASRRMSLQTQLQAAADALALAGARELNKQPGAQARASAAMANAFAASKPANTIFGMGWSPTLTYSFAFYSSLSPASEGIGGGAATGDADSKFVSVTIRPQTVSTILPASFLNAFSPNSFAAGAEAVAGFAGTTVCSVAPLFICNPYEATSGSMTDAQATAALYEALASPANLRRQFKLNRSAVAPGHFGWIETADGCNDVACMGADLASVSGACYNDSAVPLAIGDKNALEPYLDVRFDIFRQKPPLPVTSANAPAVNVRKGYLPGKSSGAVDWCSSTPASATSVYYAYPSVTTTGAVTAGSASITGVADTTGIVAGEPFVDAAGSFVSTASTPAAVGGVKGSTVTASAQAIATQAGDNFAFQWTTSGLPEDTAFPGLGGVEGDGQWDCVDYWSINHPRGPPASAVGVALGGVCGTPAETTISRYQVYRFEISLDAAAGGIDDWSGDNGWSTNGLADPQGVKNPPGAFQTENGVPYCAKASGVTGVDTTTGGVDRRNLIVPIINCVAQTELGAIGGASASSKAPVAAFGKFFLTQPFTALSDGNLYGEMTGLLSASDNVQVFNLVQLYR